MFHKGFDPVIVLTRLEGWSMAVPGSRHEQAGRRRVSTGLTAAALTLALITFAAAGPGGSIAAADEGRVHQHAVGFGYHTVFMRTESTDSYAISGPSLVYDYFIGRRWGFALRTAIFFPVLGSMSGPSGDFSGSLLDSYDQRHIGYDALAMAARRLSLGPQLTLVAGFGLHLQGFALNGAAYSPVEDDSLGVGGLGKLDYALNEWLSASGQLALGLDFFDLVDHQNPSQVVVPVSISFAFAARY
jgi:hypothetical protein